MNNIEQNIKTTTFKAFIVGALTATVVILIVTIGALLL